MRVSSWSQIRKMNQCRCSGCMLLPAQLDTWSQILIFVMCLCGRPSWESMLCRLDTQDNFHPWPMTFCWDMRGWSHRILVDTVSLLTGFWNVLTGSEISLPIFNVCSLLLDTIYAKRMKFLSSIVLASFIFLPWHHVSGRNLRLTHYTYVYSIHIYTSSSHIYIYMRM